MALDKADIDKLAWLARIAIRDEDVDDYLNDVGRILDLVDEMNRVDTDGIEALAHPLVGDVRLRDDVVTEPDRRDRYQAHAPAVERGCYLVPKVIG